MLFTSGDDPEALKQKVGAMVTDIQRARRKDPGDPQAVHTSFLCIRFTRVRKRWLEIRQACPRAENRLCRLQEDPDPQSDCRAGPGAGKAGLLSGVIPGCSTKSSKAGNEKARAVCCETNEDGAGSRQARLRDHRPVENLTSGVRLHKLIAERGLASRRSAEKLIDEGPGQC